MLRKNRPSMTFGVLSAFADLVRDARWALAIAGESGVDGAAESALEGGSRSNWRSREGAKFFHWSRNCFDHFSTPFNFAESAVASRFRFASRGSARSDYLSDVNLYSIKSR
jgi:hypothetical protein